MAGCAAFEGCSEGHQFTCGIAGLLQARELQAAIEVYDGRADRGRCLLVCFRSHRHIANGKLAVHILMGRHNEWGNDCCIAPINVCK